MQSQEVIESWLKENKITEVECMVPDMTGNARGKFIPAKKFLKEDSRLLGATHSSKKTVVFWVPHIP